MVVFACMAIQLLVTIFMAAWIVKCVKRTLDKELESIERMFNHIYMTTEVCRYILLNERGINSVSITPADEGEDG